MVLTLLDGTTVDMTGVMSGTSSSDDGKVCINVGGTFTRIIERSEIVSITLGDTTIDMNAVAE